MILGIGIDSVEISRFKNWHSYSQKKLCRIFSESEIAYCLLNPVKSAERFAARFAAREALYKAGPTFKAEPFIAFCKKITIINGKNGKPSLQIASQKWANLVLHLSLTHTKHLATAMVILEKREKTA